MILQTLKIGMLFAFLVNVNSCRAQNPNQNDLSKDFDTSPPIFYKMPSNISSRDTSPAWDQKGQQVLLTGTIYEIDGKTPAPNVILYYYQTNISGVYETDEKEERNVPKNQLGQTHGYIRGWIKTDDDGKYSIYTIMPGSYPNRDDAAHVHLYVKDQVLELPYWIDSFVFDDDPLLTTQQRRSKRNRGGSGVVRFAQKDNLKIGERNIILGLNIPNYPQTIKNAVKSGKNIGEDINSFTPFHAFGPDKGSKACPVCKYGWYHGILYFVGNNPDWSEIKQWLSFLEDESDKRKEFLKVYFVYGNETDYNKVEREIQLERLGMDLHLSKVALTFVPSFTDKSSDIHFNKINPEVDNTFLIFKRSTIIDKYIDLKPTKGNFEKIRSTLEQSTNEYFKLKRSKKE